MRNNNSTDCTAVFFDIDGTLLETRGAGHRSFVRALEKVFGWEDDIEYVNFAGNTDLNVLRQVALAHGHELTEEDTQRFWTALPIELVETCKEGTPLVYPGVDELLRTLFAHPQVVLGLVTGNFEGCAEIKLRQFNLHNYFVLGGFGNDHHDRREIARCAVQRVTASLDAGRHIGSWFLVGDSPSDVLAGKSIGATVIAVATGRFSEETLREAGADHVLRDLSDTGRVLRIIGLDGISRSADIP